MVCMVSNTRDGCALDSWFPADSWTRQFYFRLLERLVLILEIFVHGLKLYQSAVIFYMAFRVHIYHNGNGSKLRTLRYYCYVQNVE